MPIIIALIVVVALEFYLWYSLKSLTQDYPTLLRKVLIISFLTTAAIGIPGMIFMSIVAQHGPGYGVAMYFTSIVMLIYLSKLLIALFILMSDLVRWIQFLISLIISVLPSSYETNNVGNGISRLKFIQQAGWLAGGTLFSLLFMGMVKWGYDYKVWKVKLVIPRLPKGFEGMKIVQISDLHVGSFLNSNPVKKIVSIINKLEKDVIFFTGDIVNNSTPEAFPHLEILKSINAPLGVYSILGNHDYGDYQNWKSEQAKKKNFEKMIDLHRDLGWQLLRDENTVIERNGDKIALIGVENWGAARFMPKYGSLSDAYQGSEDLPVKLLMSHDPSHWDAEITEKFPDIDVTFSGHTHGAQFGIEIPGFKWSPIKYLYKQWAGLYSKGQQQLYVNRGVGFLGYPGRVGIWPEITLFELSSS